MKWNNILKNLREDLEPTPKQEDVAKKCGMTQRKISYIETGRTEPNMEDLKQLCLFYNVSADYILGLPENLPYPHR